MVTAKGSVLRPRLSQDGVTWTLLDKSAFVPTPKSREALSPERATATLEVGPKPLWVAAQEAIGLPELGAWMDAKARLPFARANVIGESMEHRPLRQLVFTETEKPNYVFVISRQHPPEITGTLALMQFIETLVSDGELSQRYRKTFQTVVIPLANPDGVEHGHWRHNMGGVDTNRDWKLFTQPETRAVRDALLSSSAKLLVRRCFSSSIFTPPAMTSSTPSPTPPRPSPPLHLPLAGRFCRAAFRTTEFKRDDAHNTGVATSKAMGLRHLRLPGHHL